MATMRAWQVYRHGEPRDALRLVDLEEPEPGPGEVRIAVSAACLGLPDVFMCRGDYRLTPPLPFVAGQEVAGVITAVGPDVDLAVGSRAMSTTAFTSGRGGFAEQTIANARGVFTPSASMTDADAAAFYIAYHTAWIGLVRRGHVFPGEHLVVLGGSGGSGAAAIQLGKALGAHVIATAGGPERGAFCRAQGADVVIDHRTESVRDAIKEATKGHGADLIYDLVGGQLAADAVRAIAAEGRMLLVGFASGTWASVSPIHVVGRNYSVIGVYAGGYSRAFLDYAQDEMSRLYEEGRITTTVTRTVPFARLPEALEELSQRSTLGRSVLVS
jgi:NADPH:quinone reductase